jgi:hypothetical protein
VVEKKAEAEQQAKETKEDTQPPQLTQEVSTPLDENTPKRKSWKILKDDVSNPDEELHCYFKEEDQEDETYGNTVPPVGSTSPPKPRDLTSAEEKELRKISRGTTSKKDVAFELAI